MNINTSPKHKAEDRHQFFYGWYVVGASAVVVFSSGPGQSYVFSIFIDSIISDTGLSRPGISALYMLSTGVSAALVWIVSRMVDRVGPRMMLIAIGFAFAAACFGMAIATNILLLYVAFASLRALGQGSLNINAVLLVNQWFVAYRGRAIALMGLGAVLSTAIFPPLARALIDNLGWREAYAVLGIIVMALIVPVSLLVVRNRPEDMSLLPDGRGHPYLDTARQAHAVSQEVSSGLQTPVFRSLNFWLLALPMASPGLVSTALVFHQTSIFEEAGLTATLAAGVFVVFSVSAAFTSVIGGFVVERTSPKLLYGFSMSMLLISLLLAVVINSAFVAIVYVIIMGVANGSQQIVQGVIWAHYYGRHGLGRIQGSAMMIGICGSAIGPFPLALLHDETGSYSVGLLVLISLPVLSLISIFFAHPTPSSIISRNQ